VFGAEAIPAFISYGDGSYHGAILYLARDNSVTKSLQILKPLMPLFGQRL